MGRVGGCWGRPSESDKIPVNVTQIHWNFNGAEEELNHGPSRVEPSARSTELYGLLAVDCRLITKQLIAG